MSIKIGLKFGNESRDYLYVGNIAPGQQLAFHDFSSGQLRHLIARCLDDNTGGAVHDGGPAAPFTWQESDKPPGSQLAGTENQITSIPAGGSYEHLVRPGDDLVAAWLVLQHVVDSLSEPEERG